MDSVELKRACELAGLDVEVIDYGSAGEDWIVNYESTPKNWHMLMSHDPALIPYVASVLVAKVKAHQVACDLIGIECGEGPPLWDCTIFLLSDKFYHGEADKEQGPFVAIIRAAVAALESQEAEG